MPAIYSHYGGGGSLELQTAIEGSFSAWGVSENWIVGSAAGRLFFLTTSYRDSDETFQISRKLGLVHVEPEFFCLLDSQLWLQLTTAPKWPFFRRTVKKRLAVFLSPTGMSLIKLFLVGNK
jgi:hypothetical protein